MFKKHAKQPINLGKCTLAVYMLDGRQYKLNFHGQRLGGSLGYVMSATSRAANWIHAQHDFIQVQNEFFPISFVKRITISPEEDWFVE